METVSWWRRFRSWFLTLRAASHRHFGNLYGDRASYMSAIKDLTRALQLNANNAEAHAMRGTIYWRELSDPDRAIRDLSRALELDRTRWDALLNRGLARQEAGDLAGALADLEQYIGFAPSGSLKTSAARIRDELATLQPDDQPRTPADQYTSRDLVRCHAVYDE